MEDEKVKLTYEEINSLEQQAEALIYLVYQLADIQESLIVDAKQLLINAGDYRFNIKRDIDAIKTKSGNLREQVWKRHQDEESAVVKFGEESDKLRKHIEDYFYDEAKDEYVPYGDDWERDMMKLTKPQIIELYKRKCKIV